MRYKGNYSAFRMSLVEHSSSVSDIGIVSPFGYNVYVKYEVVQSERFLRWLNRLRDHRARSRITGRIRRVGDGNFGDHSSVGGGVSELRVDVGQGYRIYYTIRQPDSRAETGLNVRECLYGTAGDLPSELPKSCHRR